MKKNVFKSSLIALGMLTMAACQQVPPAVNNGGYPDPIDDGSDGVELCPDGTLNCHVTFPEGSTTIINSATIFDQSFNTCMTTCMATTACSDYSPLEDAQTSCPTDYTSCSDECEWTSSESPYANMPSCDPIGIPENPKAVKVEIEGCYDEQAPYEIHFTGPTVHFNTVLEAKRGVDVYGGSLLGVVTAFGNAKIGYGVGRSPKCGSDLKNRIKVTYTPITSTSVDINDQTIGVTPFSSSAPIEKTYARPDNIPFGIPSTIRDEADLSQISWLLQGFSEADPEMKNERYGFCHYNNDNPYGTSVVMLDYDMKLFGSSYTNETVTMYMLVKSK